VDRTWTAAPSSPEFRPPAALVSTDAGQEVGEGEWDAGGGVVAGRHGGAVVVGELGGEGAPARERRREELGEG
jgi:hypothetical protein